MSLGLKSIPLHMDFIKMLGFKVHITGISNVCLVEHSLVSTVFHRAVVVVCVLKITIDLEDGLCIPYRTILAVSLY